MAGPFFAISALLMLAGALKLNRPGSTGNALRAMGLPGADWMVRILGASELLIGAWALVSGGRLAAGLVGLAYLVFAGFVAVALRRGTALSSCGCFGRPDTPPSLVHLVVDLAAVSVCGAMVAEPSGGLLQMMLDQPWGGLPFLGWVALLVYLLYVVFTDLPRTLAAAGSPREDSEALQPPQRPARAESGSPETG